MLLIIRVEQHDRKLKDLIHNVGVDMIPGGTIIRIVLY